MKEYLKVNGNVGSAKCESAGADVLLLLDSSGSISEFNWGSMQRFAIGLSRRLKLGQNAFRLAIDIFNDQPASIIPFNGYLSQSSHRLILHT